MTEQHYDVIVVGLGIMGAGALYQSAKRGATVLGIDRFDPPHSFGSSHGDTRITRQAVGEGKMYVPFVQRSNEIWRELETASGQRLYVKSGGLIIAPQAGGAQFHAYEGFVQRTAGIAETYGIDHAVYDTHTMSEKYPLFKMRQQDIAYYEPGAGVLRPELCIQMQLEQAKAHGAVVHTNEIVTRYAAAADGVTIETNKGAYTADKVILAAGAWMVDLLKPEHHPGMNIYRQVIYWFEAEDITQFYDDKFPFVIWIGEHMEDFFSVFPTTPDGTQGVKMLTEQYAATTHPDNIQRTVIPEEAANFYNQLARPRLRGVRERLIRADVCMYTVTPDEHFILDFHPESERVVVVSACSGHGFKHAAAIGESLAELALNGQSTLNIEAFRLSRLLV
jgi:sarcosine oxidase